MSSLQSDRRRIEVENCLEVGASENQNPKFFTVEDPFFTERNEKLPFLKIAYHTYGEYRFGESTVVWACHALTGNSDVFSWWEGIFGDGSLFNPKQHFIVCANVIGSCYGTTGPGSSGYEGGQLPHFPLITTRDMAKAHELLRQHLGISKIEVLIGASLGGQQALEWAIEEPTVILNLILIATNAKHSPYGIAFNESQRMAIYKDSTYGNGTLKDAKDGLAVARSIAMLSYRSYAGYLHTQSEKDDSKMDEFAASSYQEYQGKKLASRFNAYSYVSLLKSMDAHNVGRNRGSVREALNKVKANTLVIGIDSDNLFPVSEQLYLKEGISTAKISTITSDFGHDGFLVENEQLVRLIQDFLYHQFKNFLPTTFKRNKK